MLAVVTLATYVVALFLFGGMATQYEAQTSVHLHAGHPLAAGTATVGEPLSALGELLSQDAEAKVLAECGLAQEGAVRMRAAQARLFVFVSAEDRPQGDVKIDVRYSDADATTAAAVAAHVGSAYAAAFSARVESDLARRHAESRKSADDSNQSYRLAEAELRTFLDQALAGLVENLASGTGGPARAGYFARPVAAAPSAVQLTSGPTLTRQQREMLQSQLGELRRERERMLKTLTEQHPDVVRLNEMIADMERKLAGPGQAPAMANPLAPAAPTAPSPPTEAQKLAELQEAQWELAERYAMLSAEVATARAEFEKRGGAERAAFQRFCDARAADLAAVETVQSEPVIDRRALKQVMLLSLVVSVCLGLAAARSVLIAVAQFETVEQLRRELPLPVIEADARSASRPVHGARIARSLAGGAKLAAELVLCAAVIWFCMMAFYETGFAGDFLADPMGVLAQGMTRTVGAMGW